MGTAARLPIEPHDLHHLADQVPVAARLRLDAGDPRLAAAPAQDPAVGELPASTRVKRRLLEEHRARARLDHPGLDHQHFGILVTEVARHGLPQGRAFRASAKCVILVSKSASTARAAGATIAAFGSAPANSTTAA